MLHCMTVQAEGGYRTSRRHGKVDSEFEADVVEALIARGVEVQHQYPACGFSIDLMCELGGERLAVECDGEIYHEDEHGNLRIEDLERQAVLERAGWRVLRIPYRKWRRQPELQVGRVLDALRFHPDDEDYDDELDEDKGHLDASVPSNSGRVRAKQVTAEQASVVEGLRSGMRTEEDVLRFAREHLGYKKLGPRIRERLLLAGRQLAQMGLLVIEDGEYFLTPAGRAGVLKAGPPTVSRQSSSRSNRSRTRRKSGYGAYRYRGN
jgi:very-short-patch-repair endonuclease